ncbi:MAG: hypothetical protein JRJ11_03670 [Deltaproteobacteria bacterium]|nr:hypothetical protein [Deltaproteobacteria bacterium]MBW1908624.1 hypothetical protein [Deltaproteobacteria bacterium]MBW2032359.1 hypothetical protein [Deltaproteobacteria bacterium]MBW2169434.1 hypothetical protein [Deltaproteobacteria bacterium]
MAKIKDILVKWYRIPGMSDSTICARYVTIILGNLAKVVAATEYTKHHGKAILE